MNMIEVKDVSICFRMANDKLNSLKEFMIQKVKGKLKYEEFWALKDVSFNVKKGEVVGIVGHNGAGKSTILKVISGIMKPTEGTVVTHGNIVPMLELGSGFDMDLSGRENIYLNGSILGYSKEFLDEKFDEILEYVVERSTLFEQCHRLIVRQIQFFHRNNLCISTTCCSTFDTETWTK